MRKSIALFLGLMLWTAYPASAQVEDLSSVTVEGQSSKPNATEASREITAWAQSTVAREQAIELLGDAAYQKRKAEVENKIVKQASKFMPFVNPGDVSQQPDGTFKMPVTLKISMPSLRKLVLENGLLNEAGSPTSMVPLIAFTDRRKGQSVRWWIGEPSDPALKETVDTEREMNQTVSTAFSKKGFFVARPQEGPSLPEALRTDRPQGESLSGIAKHFSTALAVRGDLRYTAAHEEGDAVAGSIKLEVVHAQSDRVIADVTKTFASTSGKDLKSSTMKALTEASEDLARQVAEVWQRGTLNANSLRLIVRGNLDPKQLTAFKTALTAKVREVRSLRDRVYQRGEVEIDLDYTGGAAPFTNRLKALSLPGFSVKVADSTPESVTLDVQPQ